MTKITATGTLKEGTLKIHNRTVFDADLFSMKDGEVNILVESIGRKRTSPQNRYYHGVVVKLVRQGLLDLGHELNDEDTHEFLKSKFNPKTIVFEETGEVSHYGGTTTELNTVDMNIYIEKIQRFAAEYLNTFIPDPII